MALSGLKCIDLNNDCIKILGINYSYNEECARVANYVNTVKKVQNVVQTWKWRNLTLSGKITIFKTLAFSKVVFLSYLSNVPNSTINCLENIQSDFLWSGKRAKVKHLDLIK